jgi:hypothetical protein
MIAQVFFNVGETDVTGVVNGIDVEAEARLFPSATMLLRVRIWI